LWWPIFPSLAFCSLAVVTLGSDVLRRREVEPFFLANRLSKRVTHFVIRIQVNLRLALFLIPIIDWLLLTGYCWRLPFAFCFSVSSIARLASNVLWIRVKFKGWNCHCLSSNIGTKVLKTSVSSFWRLRLFEMGPGRKKICCTFLPRTRLLHIAFHREEILEADVRLYLQGMLIYSTMNVRKTTNELQQCLFTLQVSITEGYKSCGGLHMLCLHMRAETLLTVLAVMPIIVDISIFFDNGMAITC